MSSSLVAAVQMTSRGDLAANLAAATRGIDEAAARGAKLVVLPENFAFVGAHERDKLAVAETLDAARPGPIVSALGAAAARRGVWVIGGGMPEKTERAGFVHNTAVVLGADGRLVASYRKIHLFDIDIPNGAQFKESASVIPGSDRVVVETPVGRVGLSICYDLRFPELYRSLVQAGAEIIVVPAAFTLHTGKDHWLPLLTARAIENQVYVVAPGQYGRAYENRVCWGKSLIIDPWGQALATAADRECVIVAEIDRVYQDKVRRELPCLTHRRI